jgi:hypothetical protein
MKFYKLATPTGPDIIERFSVGQEYKIILEATEETDTPGMSEAIWVSCLAVLKDGSCVGAFTNTPIVIPALEYGDLVGFSIKHVKDAS